MAAQSKSIERAKLIHWHTVMADEPTRNEKKRQKHRATASMLADGLDCTRSHPHDEMSPMCELRTEIAKLNHKIAVMEADAKSGGVVCQTCGLHDVSFEKICHNSACDSYGQSVTVFEGWKTKTLYKPNGEMAILVGILRGISAIIRAGECERLSVKDCESIEKAANMLFYDMR